MKSLFAQDVFFETVKRIEVFEASASRQWGKMSPAQMLEHAARALEMACGKGPQKQFWLGKLIGWAVRPSFVGEKPFSKDSPTAPEFVITDEPDFGQAKIRLLILIREFQAKGEAGVNGNVHAFFGRMSGTEWGATQWKHLDHHLRQFGG